MNQDRLGYYLVGDKKFYSKTLALLESYSQRPSNLTWVFNDSVYSSIDWQTPIYESLPELYLRRALQLRNQYDYLVLYYSGGADSGNILKTFINNNIFLDEIVMQLPESARKNFNDRDKSNGNIYSELEFSAKPVLEKYRNKLHPNTLIRYQDISKPIFDLFEKDNWFETNPMGTNISIAGIARQAAQVAETHILDLCYKGLKTAQIVGVDKPLVHFDGRNYYAYFLDVNAMHSPPVDLTKNEIFYNLYQTEFFYWTPDMPEIVVKQAQEIKKVCEVSEYHRNMMLKSFVKHISEFRPVLHNIIYPNNIEVPWDPEKPNSKILRPMDNWFWHQASAKIKNNYLDVIKYIKENTDPGKMIDDDIQNGISGHRSIMYKL